MFRKSRFSILVIIILFLGCGKPIPREIITYYPSGNIESVVRFENPKDSTRYKVEWFRDDGSMICEGTKRNYEKDGNWIYYDEGDRMLSVENFCNGFLCDTQKIYYITGTIQQIKILEQEISCFSDTACNYQLISYWPNENLKEKSYFKDCKYHDTRFFFDSLTGRPLQKISYEMGVLNGLYERYLEDGAVMKGTYLEGNPNGRWTTTLGDSLISEKTYN